MFPLRCTVRDCQQPLQQKDRGLFCASGHHFDRAKEGYWNLLQPQDRRSRNPGDCDEAVLARHRWLTAGYASGLMDELRPWTGLTTSVEANSGPNTLDLGCGEGSFAPALFPTSADTFCGIDLSKRAIKLAARGWPQATWVLANADRVLPVADGCVHRIVSLFGRRPASEIGRVIAHGGTCIVAVPGEEDLIELRQQVQQSGNRRSRWETVAEEFTQVGLELVEQKKWVHRERLEPNAIQDALAMTYRAVRRSQQSRLEGISAMTVTMAADLILLRGK